MCYAPARTRPETRAVRSYRTVQVGLKHAHNRMCGMSRRNLLPVFSLKGYSLLEGCPVACRVSDATAS